MYIEGFSSSHTGMEGAAAVSAPMESNAAGQSEADRTRLQALEVRMAALEAKASPAPTDSSTRLEQMAADLERLQNEVHMLRSLLHARFESEGMGYILKSDASILRSTFKVWGFYTGVRRVRRFREMASADTEAGKPFSEEEEAEEIEQAQEAGFGTAAGFRLKVHIGALVSALRAPLRSSSSAATDESGMDNEQLDEASRPGWMRRVEGALMELRERVDRMSEKDELRKQAMTASRQQHAADATTSRSSSASDIAEVAAVAQSLLAQSSAHEAEVKRIGSSLTSLSSESKSAEGAIAQALKLLQAQTVTKASRHEMRQAVARALEAALDGQERAREVAAAIERVEAVLPTKATKEELARLEAALAALAASGELQTREWGLATRQLDHVDSATHCLSCHQPLPTPSAPPPPHLYHTSSRGGGSPRRSPREVEAAGFQPTGPRDGVDPLRHAKHIYSPVAAAATGGGKESPADCGSRARSSKGRRPPQPDRQQEREVRSHSVDGMHMGMQSVRSHSIDGMHNNVEAARAGTSRATPGTPEIAGFAFGGAARANHQQSACHRLGPPSATATASGEVRRMRASASACGTLGGPVSSLKPLRSDDGLESQQTARPPAVTFAAAGGAGPAGGNSGSATSPHSRTPRPSAEEVECES